MNTNFKVIGLTRLRIKPKSTASEADALTTRTSELFILPLTVLVLPLGHLSTQPSVLFINLYNILYVKDHSLEHTYTLHPIICVKTNNDCSLLSFILAQLLLFDIKIKSSLYCTRNITPKRVTSGGAHLQGLVPRLHSSEGTSQRWRVVGDTVPI